MGLSIPQMTRMSRLLDEALPLDAAGRCRWLEALPEEHRDLAQALRDALLPDDAQLAEIESLAALPELGTAIEAGVPSASGLQIGARVGPYQLIRPLGGGGMAEVWLARRAEAPSSGKWRSSCRCQVTCVPISSNASPESATSWRASSIRTSRVCTMREWIPAGCLICRWSTLKDAR
jgi:hypothetical protein